MRFLIIVLSLAAFSASSAFAKDWGRMSEKEKLSWAGSYVHQNCPGGLSGVDYGRKSEIGNVPQFLVRMYLASHCKS